MTRLSAAATLVGLMCCALPARAQDHAGSPEAAASAAQASDPARVAWLRAHVVARGPVDGPFRFHFPADFYRNRLFLVGESHGSAAPHRFDAALFAHLHDRIGLRDYAAELDPVQAAHVNAYLRSGDERYLGAIFNFWHRTGAQWGNLAHLQKWRELRAIQIRSGRAVRVHGFDRVQDFAGAAAWLRARGTIVDPAEVAAPATRVERARRLLAAMGEGRRNEAADVAALRRVLAAEIAGQDREMVIFGSWRAFVGATSRPRAAMGLWGLFHVLQAGANGSRPFAALARQASGPQVGIASILLLPIDGASLIPIASPGGGFTPTRVTMLNFSGPLLQAQGAADLAQAAPPGQITVYDLDSADSPYRRGQDFIRVRSSIDRGITPDDPVLSTANFSRYVGAMRGSDWASPLTDALPERSAVSR